MGKRYLFNYLEDRPKQESYQYKSNIFLEVLGLVKIFSLKMNGNIKAALMSIKLWRRTSRRSVNIQQAILVILYCRTKLKKFLIYDKEKSSFNIHTYICSPSPFRTQVCPTFNIVFIGNDGIKLLHSLLSRIFSSLKSLRTYGNTKDEDLEVYHKSS